MMIFQPLHKGESPANPQTYEYPNSVVVKTNISVAELSDVIETLATTGKLKVKGIGDVNCTGRFSQGPWNDFTESRDDRFHNEWPVNTFVFEPNPKATVPAEPYVALGAPLYPTYWELLRVSTGVDVSRYNQYAGSVLFLLPNYSARIEELRLTSDALKVKIRSRETRNDMILGKLYCEKFGGPILQKDIDFPEDTAEIPLGFIPDMWQVYIMSKETGEQLDLRKAYASWASLPAGVVVDMGPADINEMMTRGENEHVEFKRDLNKEHDEFLESVLSFANSRGGSILVGVDDNGSIVGVYEQKFEERVQSMVRDTCDPQPKLSIEPKEVDSKTIYMVKVSEGENKPYNLRNRGFFVRAGSTDRLMSRIEMDAIYVRSKLHLPGYW